jgi:hypothetical protein
VLRLGPNSNFVCYPQAVQTACRMAYGLGSSCKVSMCAVANQCYSVRTTSMLILLAGMAYGLGNSCKTSTCAACARRLHWMALMRRQHLTSTRVRCVTCSSAKLADRTGEHRCSQGLYHAARHCNNTIATSSTCLQAGFLQEAEWGASGHHQACLNLHRTNHYYHTLTQINC